MRALLHLLSRLAPRWRRDEWLREWSAEIDATGTRRPVSLSVGAAAHVLWLWRHEWSLDMLASDIRFALRTLRARPGFALTVALTLALGIAATTAMFTVVDAVVLRALPYPHADRLAVVWPRTTFSPRDLAESTWPRETFEAVGAYSAWGFTLTGGGEAEAVQGARLTPALLEVLGVQPIIGRWFEPEAVRLGRGHVALVGEGLWRRRFGGDPSAVGGRLTIDGVDYVIAGVMPASFEFPTRRSEIWTPITIDSSTGDYNANFATLIARVPAGSSVAAADAVMRAYADRLHGQDPKRYNDRFLQRAVVTPLQGHLVRDVRKPLLLLLAAMGLLLVIACANTAHLMLARSGSREAEIAVRTALGATRPRLVRQLLVEGAILAAAGGAAGVLLAQWLVSVFVPLVPNLPEVSRAVVLDRRVLAFAVVLAASSAVLFGLAPALQVSRPNSQALSAAGRSGGRSRRRASIGRLLVLGEVAVATALVVSAALLGRSFVHLTRVDVGFQPDHVLTLRAAAPEFRYKDDDQLRILFTDVLQRVRALPGVEAAGAIHLLPLTPDNWNPGLTIDGVPAAGQYQSDVNWRVVTPGYFEAMRVPLRTGRLFADSDDARALPVALVNEAFVHAVFQNGIAMGRRIRTFFEGKDNWATIVGIVGDVRQHTVDQPSLPEMYRPFAQHPLSGLQIMVRVTRAPEDAVPDVRRAIGSLEPDVALADVQPLDAVVDAALGGARVPFFLATLLSITAMALGVIGIAGLLSFDVAEQRSEIGVRLALGASPGRIRRMFLARGLRLGIAGVVSGALAALAAASLLRSLLFDVSATDPATIVLVGVTFVLAIVAAAYLPARRAGQLDPLETLRAK